MSQELFNNYSAILQLVYAFGIGFVSCFTPCVFPLIPITLALFGVRENTSALKGFLLSSCYVLGIAVTYTTLGMLAAKTNMVFGAFLGNPYVVLGLDIFLIAMALYSLEVFELTFFSKLQSAGSKVGGQGFLGAFLMGLVSGFVAAPCVGPALVFVLGIAASAQSVPWGAAILFSYSMGFGVIFVLLGTFSQLTKKLPKSGNWLNATKFLIACALMGVVLFLSQRYILALTQSITFKDSALLIAILALLGICAALLSYKHNKKIVRTVGAFLLTFAIFQYFFSAGNLHQDLHWHTNIEAAIAEGKQQNKIAMVDLFADWCGGCKELDSKTFSDPRVKDMLKEIVVARIDFTDTEAETPVKITARYGVKGLPCVLFLKADGSGDEISQTSRITGYIPADDFIKHLHDLSH